jgi:hypothetical protein
MKINSRKEKCFMTENGNSMIMPVAPAYGGGGFGGFGGYNDDIWLIIILLFACGGWGNGFGGGFGGFGNMALGYDFPWLLNGQQGINANTNAGFNQAATAGAISSLQNSVTSGFGDVQLGIAGVNQNICQPGNGITQAVANGFAQAEIANNARQIADMQQSFANQTATLQGFNGVQSQLASCCCENRLSSCQTQNIIQNEGNATRFADANNTRDIIQSQTQGTQAILDKLCQLELDGVKAQVDAKNDRIAELTTQLNMATLRESQTAQNAFIQQGLTNEVDQLYTRLSSCPIPSTPVFGRTPIFTCNNGGCGCGM